MTDEERGDFCDMLHDLLETGYRRGYDGEAMVIEMAHFAINSAESEGHDLIAELFGH